MLEVSEDVIELGADEIEGALRNLQHNSKENEAAVVDIFSYMDVDKSGSIDMQVQA